MPGELSPAGLAKRRKGGVHLSPLLPVPTAPFILLSAALNPFDGHPLSNQASGSLECLFVAKRRQKTESTLREMKINSFLSRSQRQFRIFES